MRENGGEGKNSDLQNPFHISPSPRENASQMQHKSHLCEIQYYASNQAPFYTLNCIVSSQSGHQRQEQILNSLDLL